MAAEQPPPPASTDPPRSRRPATAREAKAMGHPLRMRILRLCLHQELTNKELADRLGRDPATVYYHVRLLADVGLLHPAPVRTGASGALEKPYRSTGLSWWLSTADTDVASDARLAPIEAFTEELRDAGPESLETFARFVLHLSPEDAKELERRILEILDTYVETDDQRHDQPAYGGLLALHRLAE